jgi:hypothetical protein
MKLSDEQIEDIFYNNARQLFADHLNTQEAS